MTTTKLRVLLSDIVPVDDFLADISAGRIQERAHPEDAELRIYTYTKKTQFGGLWTPAARLARGLILRVPNDDFNLATVEGRGLPKFFTIEQSKDEWGRAKLVDDDENVVVDEAPEIPWEMPAVVSEKMNGALGLGYIAPSGYPAISTKGSFASLEATIGSRVLAEKLADHSELMVDLVSKDYTPLFEIITPARPHPVDYGNLEDLIYLGYISNSDGSWHPAEDSHSFVKFGFTPASVLSYSTLQEAVDAPYKDNTEGFVVTVVGAGPEAIYKVKPDEYLRLRRLFYALQDTELKDFMLERGFTENLHEIDSPDSVDLSDLVGELHLNEQMKRMLNNRQRSIFEEVVKPAQSLIESVETEVKAMGDLLSMTRGDVAFYIKENHGDSMSIYFSVYDDLVNNTHRANAPAVKMILARIYNGA